MRRRPNSFPWVLLILGVVGGFLLLGAAGIWVGLRLAERRGAPPPVRGPFVPPDRTEERKEAATAFSDPTPPDSVQRQTLTDFFNRLTAGLAAPKGNLDGLFDLDRMFDELMAIGAFQRMKIRPDESFRRSFVSGAKQSLTEKLRQSWSLAKWTSTEVRRTRTAPSGDVVVFIVLILEDGTRAKMRFWLTNKPGHGWRMYDWEDLEFGVRATHAAAAAVGLMNGDLTNLAELQSLSNLPKAAFALRDGELATARQLLDGCKAAATTATGPFLDLYDLVESSYELVVGQHQAAGQRLDRLIRRNSDMPGAYVLRSSVRLHLQEYDGAAEDAEHYLKLLGADANALTCLAVAREGQGRPEDALATIRKALAEEPGYLDALHGYLRMLPIAHNKEFLTELAKAPKPHDLYDALIDEARDNDNDAAVEMLAEWLHKERPNDLRAIKSLISLRATAGKTAEAITLYKAGLKVAQTEKDRDQLRSAFLYALADLNLHIEAYAAVPATEAKDAFSTLAFDLNETLNDSFEENEAADELRTANQLLDKLIVAHRLRVPSDLWPNYFEGQRLIRAKDYAGADKKFADALAKIPFANDEDADDQSNYDSFRSARVESLYRLGRRLIAYRDLPPRSATFDELANLYHDDRDAGGLRKLLDAHRRAEPKDAILDYWTAQLHWDQKDYEPAVRLLKQYVAATRKKDGELVRYSWTVDDQITRGLMRLNRPREVQTYVVLLGERAPPMLRVLSFAANGVHDSATYTMLQMTAQSPWQVEVLYSDPDMGPLLKRDEYKPFRDKHPAPPPPPGKIG